MRLFELLALLALLMNVINALIPGRRRGLASLLAGVAVVAVVLHLLLEGYRWQMALIITYCAAFTIWAVVQWFEKAPSPEKTPKRLLRISLSVIAILLFVFAAVWPVLIPMFSLPEPSGPHTVGSTIMHLPDTARKETMGTTPGGPRELLVRFWYPCATPAPDAVPMVYEPDARQLGVALANYLHFPPFLFDHFTLIPSHAYLNAPVAAAEQPYPIIVFNHGLWGILAQNTILFEELASHGYIVASIAHPHESMLVVYHDGCTVPHDWEREKIMSAEMKALGETRIRKRFSQSTDPVEQLALMQETVNGLPTWMESMGIWMEDNAFVLDQLMAMQAGERKSLFTGHLDLENIGVMGMSFGAVMTGFAAHDEPRYKAALNLDGPRLGMHIQTPFERPYMYLMADKGYQPLDLSFDQAKAPCYHLRFEDTTHLNFSDTSILAPLFTRMMDMVGPADGKELLQRINGYALAFFDTHLKGQPSPLLNPEQSPPDGVIIKYSHP